jgi:hypothetical protein
LRSAVGERAEGWGARVRAEKEELAACNAKVQQTDLPIYNKESSIALIGFLVCALEAAILFAPSGDALAHVVVDWLVVLLAVLVFGQPSLRSRGFSQRVLSLMHVLPVRDLCLCPQPARTDTPRFMTL